MEYEKNEIYFAAKAAESPSPERIDIFFIFVKDFKVWVVGFKLSKLSYFCIFFTVKKKVLLCLNLPCLAVPTCPLLTARFALSTCFHREVVVTEPVLGQDLPLLFLSNREDCSANFYSLFRVT